MKRVLMPAAFAFAVISAIAFKPTEMSSKFKVNPDPLGADRCLPTTECIAGPLNNCEVQIYQNESSPLGSCINPVSYDKLD
jgi:hypothetical protein